MDSESSDETSSSECSTESSSDDDGMEIAEINNDKIQLPQGLCEHKSIFQEIFSIETWNNVLTEQNRKYLEKFLPSMQNDPKEKLKTLKKLFNFEQFHFYSPLEKFHENLKNGYYRPDIANMRRIIRKAERKEAQLRYRKYREKLKQDVIESQKNLLNQIHNLPPGIEPNKSSKTITSTTDIDFLIHRTKRRYYQILSTIQTKCDDNYCSPDENYPEGPPITLSRKQRRHLNSLKNNYQTKNAVFYSTTMERHNFDLEKFITPFRNPFYINDENYKCLLINHKKRKLDNDDKDEDDDDNVDHQEMNTRGITINDVIKRTQLPFIRNFKPKKLLKVKKDSSNSDYFESDSSQDVKVKKIKTTTTPITVPPPAAAAPPPPPPPPLPTPPPPPPPSSSLPLKITPQKQELRQETHSNFLALIRDVICSTNDHRINFNKLEESIKQWQMNPISPLNVWYNHTTNWTDLLKSAVNFLCGDAVDQPDDFVPYMEYKPILDQYQWIGAGRDSDQLLQPLCEYWLEHRTDKNKEDLSDRSQTPPPPRCPTTWTVRKATAEEVRNYRDQEKQRYNNPHKAFTFLCNGYESIVGPLKNIPSMNLNTKARGHTMLNADRPNFVTILSLVRDATARLPNGEGTRADICELLKSSQYISNTAPDNVLQSVVSGALDRMHTQFDPCVKYDSKRKIWIYLHRNRNEEDFERIHQQYQSITTKNKPKKKTTKVKTVEDKICKTQELEGRTNKKNSIKILPPQRSPKTEVKQSKMQIVQKLPFEKVATTTTTIVTTTKTITTTTPPLLQNLSQLQNIKNVTLLRNNNSNNNDKLSNTTIQEHNIQIKTQTSLTPQQQQQIIQTIKQKILPQATILNQQQQQQQIILKQKTIKQLSAQQQTILNTATIQQPQQSKFTDLKSTPVVAKVLTNAAGQVISVENLLTHQKQHGGLPQGATLRVSGHKGPNIIQLTAANATTTTTSVTKNPITQFAVTSQNNIIAITNQPKLVVASQHQQHQQQHTTSLSTTKSMQKTITKFPQKITTQQLINAKLIDGQKIVQPKIFQGNQIKLATPTNNNSKTTKPINLQQNTTTIRMVNAANLNLTHIGGKPVLLASKGSTIQNLQGQNVLLQPATTTNSIVIKNPTTLQQNVVLGQQIKVQQPQTQMLFGKTGQQQHQHIVLEGGSVRLQQQQHHQQNATTQRVVLATANSHQGQGGQILAQQILLPAGFQGTAINIKSLQGVKVIPIAQAQNRGVQGRQVFARVMGPSIVKTAPQAISSNSSEKLTSDPTITSSD